MERNAIFSALKMNFPNMLITAIEEGADMNERNEDGATPLILAVMSQQIECVHILISKGANPDDDLNGFSPLMIAAQEGTVDVAQALIGNADVNYKGQHGLTPLMAAARDGHEEMVKFLLANSADAKVTTNKGTTAMMMAKQFGHNKTVELLEKHLGIFDYGIIQELSDSCVVVDLEKNR